MTDETDDVTHRLTASDAEAVTTVRERLTSSPALKREAFSSILRKLIIRAR